MLCVYFCYVFFKCFMFECYARNLCYICRNLQLTDLSVQYLTGVCHNIRHLDISSTEHIT